MVGYLLDQRLREQGLRLDGVMAAAYRKFGLTGDQYMNAVLLALEEEVADAETSACLGMYVNQGAPLPNITSFHRLL